MKRLLSTALFMALLIPMAIGGGSGQDNTPKPATNEDAIEWLTFDEAVKKMKKNPKKIFMDVYTDWCGWCKVMDKQTFTDPFIIQYINANYYAVKFNAEQKETISFQGKDYKFVVTDPARNKGYHELAAYILNGKLSYPTVVFMDEDMNVLTPVPGFRRPPELDMMLKFFGGNHYKDTAYETFTQNYKSPYNQ